MNFPVLRNISLLSDKAAAYEAYIRAYQQARNQNVYAQDMRIRSIAHFILFVPFFCCNACLDLYRINRYMWVEGHCSILQVIKADLVYLTIGFATLAQIGLNSICPEPFLRRNFDFKETIKNRINLFFKNYAVNMNVVFALTGTHAELLPDRGASLVNFHAEFAQRLQESRDFPNNDTIKRICDTLLLTHYNRLDVVLATARDDTGIYIDALIRQDRECIRQHVLRCSDLEREFENTSLDVLIEQRFGADFLATIINNLPLEEELFGAFLQKLIMRKSPIAVLILNRIERLELALRPAWWQQPSKCTQLFMLSAYANNKAAAEKFVPLLSQNTRIRDKYILQNPTGARRIPLMKALENGWHDIAQTMLSIGVDLSIQDEHKKTAYMYVEESLGQDTAIAHINFKAKKCECLLYDLFKQKNEERMKKILACTCKNNSLFSIENRPVLSVLYRIAVEYDCLEARQKLLPFVDFALTNFDSAFPDDTLLESLSYESPNNHAFGDDIIADIQSLDIKNYDQIVPLLRLLVLQQQLPLATQLIAQLLALSEQEKSLWVSRKQHFSALCFALLDQRQGSLAEAFLPYVNPLYQEEQTKMSLLMMAAIKEHDSIALKLVQQGSLIHEIDSSGTLAWEYIVRFCSQERTSAIAHALKEAHIAHLNSQGKCLFVALEKKGLACGPLVDILKTLFLSFGIRDYPIIDTTSIATLSRYLLSPNYIFNASIQPEQKKKAISLFIDDAIKARLWNLIPFSIETQHMHYVTHRVYGEISPLPADYRLDLCVEEVLHCIDTLWPSAEKIYDDGAYHSKAYLLNSIRSNVIQQNNSELKNMYGRIFIALQQNIRHIALLSDQKRMMAQKEIKRLVQAIAVSFLHCTDRQVSDGRRFYAQIVENNRRTLEEEEQSALEELVHEELLKLRRAIFHTSYLSVDTNRYDASTQRFIENACNQEFGLHYPPLQTVRDWTSYALRDRLQTVQARFKEAYNPCRIANHLHPLIANAMQNPSSSPKWYAKVQAYLENKHPNINWNDVFDIDAMTITPKGLEMLLVDLTIIKAN